MESNARPLKQANLSAIDQAAVQERRVPIPRKVTYLEMAFHIHRKFLVTFIKIYHGGCVIDSKITIKPGVCTKT